MTRQPLRSIGAISPSSKKPPALMPIRVADLRRHPRIPVDLAAAPVQQIGLADTRGATQPGDDARTASRPPTPASGVTLRCGRIGNAGRPCCTIRRPAAMFSRLPNSVVTGKRAAEPGAAAPVADDAQWRLTDRSVTGWRVCAPVSIGQRVDLRRTDRRARIRRRRLDAGGGPPGAQTRKAARSRRGAIIDRVVAIMLHARRATDNDMSVVVDGVDVAAMGPICRALSAGIAPGLRKCRYGRCHPDGGICRGTPADARDGPIELRSCCAI